MLDVVCEYIWIGGSGELRSKTRVIKNINTVKDVLEWNYDGSSTLQANSDGNTEVIIKPIAFYKDPLRNIENFDCILVLCETFDQNGNPLPTNYRRKSDELFNRRLEIEPWFGLEQEYFIELTNKCVENDGLHYCGISCDKVERLIVEEHLLACLSIGLTISGINAEVAPRQWEFQIGPVVGIDAADQLYIARYLLERIAEKHGAHISYYPKPSSETNGSGCHINFSTNVIRDPNGINEILLCMDKLEKKHREHIAVYGEHNELRLTGKHETSSIDVFSFGKGTRNTSVRIPNQTIKDGCGYFEDRRPSANVEPYQATSILFETCCL